MAFTLPDLPYPHDALAPYMSRETLEYHHDKHHLAYVNNGNNLLKGTEWEGKPLEEIVKGSFGKNAGLFNNAGQHYNHLHFWKWMKPNGGGDKIPGKLEKEDHRGPRLGRQDEGGLHPGRRHAVRLGLVLARGQGRQDRRDEDAERRKPAGPWRASRSSAATCGSTPTTSTTAIAGPTISRRSSITSSIGTTSPNCMDGQLHKFAARRRRGLKFPGGGIVNSR